MQKAVSIPLNFKPIDSSILKQAIVPTAFIGSPDISLGIILKVQNNFKKKLTFQLSLEQPKNYNFVWVMEEEALVGIFTEGDLVKLVIIGQNLEGVEIPRVMTQPAITLRKSQRQDIFRILCGFDDRIRPIPLVTKSGGIVGVLTPERVDRILDAPNLLNRLALAEVTTSAGLTTPTTASILEVAREMAIHRVSCEIADRESDLTRDDSSTKAPLSIPVGMVTESHLVQLQALGMDWAKIWVRDGMEKRLSRVKLADSLWEVHRAMQRGQAEQVLGRSDRAQLLKSVTQAQLLPTLGLKEMYSVVKELLQSVQRLEAEKVELFRAWELEQQQVRIRSNRMRSHQKILMELAKDKILQSDNLEHKISKIIETAARTLEVERTSVWLYNTQRSQIRCIDLYDRRLDYHDRNVEFTEASYSAYLHDILCDRTHAVRGLHAEGRTVELSASYQSESGNASVLDVAIWLNGEVVGVLCHDRLGKPGQWTTEEQNFAAAIADFISLALEAENSKQAQFALQKAQQELAIRVEKRTATLKQTTAELQAKIAELQQTQAALHYRIQFEDLIAKLSTEFISLPIAEMDSKIEQTLQQIGEFVGVDRTYVVLSFGDRHQADKIYQWCAAGVQPLPENAHSSISSNTATSKPFNPSEPIDRHCDNKPNRIAAPMRSGVRVPLKSSESDIGFLGLDCVQTPITWSADTIALLQMVGQIFVNAIQRQQTVEALHQSEERFTLAVEGANDGIWDWNMKSGEAYFSSRWKSMLGYEPHEIAHTIEEWTQRLHPEDRESTFQALQDYLNGKSSVYEVEFRLLCKDKTYRWILARGAALRDKSGQPYRMAGSHTDITKRKQAEEALQLTQFSLDRNGDPVFWIEPDGRFAYVNEAACQVLGYSRKELLQMSVEAIAPNFSAQPWPAQWRQLQRSRFLKLESHLQTKAGRIFPVEIGANYLKFKGKEYNCVFVRDISERVRSQQEKTQLIDSLQQSQRFTQQIADTNPNILYIYDCLTGCNIYANFQVKEFLGYTPEEIQQMKSQVLPTLVHPEDLDRVLKLHKRLATAKDNEIFEIEYRLKHANGEWRWFSSRETIFSRTTEGITQQILGTAQDISDRKHAEEALRESEERFRLMADSAPVMLWLMGRNGRCTFVNQYCVAFTGRPASEQLNTGWVKILHPEDRERCWKAYWAAFERRESYEMEFRLRRADGEYRWILSTGIPRVTPTGQFGGYIGSCVDITARKQAEQEMGYALKKEKELNELKTRFVSMSSHEFRTPLATISFSAGLLEKYGDKWDAPKKLKHIHRIQTCVERMNGLLNDVLLIGKTDAGKIEVNPTPIELVEFCRNLVEEIEEGMGAEGAIAFESDRVSIHAHMDDKLLHHILSNLLSNAIKYSPDRCNVRFTVSCDRQQEVIFRIEDRGIGIPLEDRNQLFELFHRGSNVGTIEGTGLGLAIVKRCVDCHGGKIAANSEVGVGTTFTIRLPSDLSDADAGTKI